LGSFVTGPAFARAESTVALQPGSMDVLDGITMSLASQVKTEFDTRATSNATGVYDVLFHLDAQAAFTLDIEHQLFSGDPRSGSYAIEAFLFSVATNDFVAGTRSTVAAGPFDLTYDETIASSSSGLLAPGDYRLYFTAIVSSQSLSLRALPPAVGASLTSSLDFQLHELPTDIQPVPEPATLTLIAMGLAASASHRRLERRARAR
jgi:hypothetical protein